MLSVLLLAVVPVEAAKPAPTAYFAKVDVIVVNRVRSHSTSYDDWGRPTHKYSEQWWVSFWECAWVPTVPAIGAVPFAWIDRGWWSCSQCRAIVPCSGGWLVESKDGMNVIAPALWVVDSPFDWEVRMRRIYRPLCRP